MEYTIKNLFHMIKAHRSGIRWLESLRECYLNSTLEQDFIVIKYFPLPDSPFLI